MSKQGLEVPKKPTDKSEMWPGKLVKKANGRFWIEYKDITAGPFPNKQEAGWYDAMLTDVLGGYKEKSLFAGRIIQFGDAYYVERWDQLDGPFENLDVASRYRQHLYDKYNAYPEDYVGIVFQLGEGKFWVDRGNKEDGPFPTRAAAQQHHDDLMANINKDKTNTPGEEK